MVIDCDECVMQYTNACEDCFVTVVLGVTIDGSAIDGSPVDGFAVDGFAVGGLRASSKVELDDEEAAAVGNLAELGLVPKLRLVPREYRTTAEADDAATG